MQVELESPGIRDRVLALRATPALAPLHDDDLVALAEHARLREFEPGSALMTEGEPPSSVHFLLDGHVRIERRGRTLVDVRGTGHVGLIALVAELPAPGAIAAERTRTLEIPADVVTMTMHERFDVARHSVRLIAAELVARRGQLPVPVGGSDEPDVGTPRARPLTLVEKMLTIRRFPAFERANLDAIAELAKHAKDVRFEAGVRLWQVGDPAHTSLRIDYGRVACENGRGDRVVIGAGHALGGMDSLGLGRRSYSAVALTDVVGLEMRTAVQLAVVEVHPALARELRKSLATMVLMMEGG